MEQATGTQTMRTGVMADTCEHFYVKEPLLTKFLLKIDKLTQLIWYKISQAESKNLSLRVNFKFLHGFTNNP